MAKTEKIAFILEQVRLCLDKKDFIRAHILSKKISSRAFVERKGEGQGDIGIEGSTIEAPDAVRGGGGGWRCCWLWVVVVARRRPGGWAAIGASPLQAGPPTRGAGRVGGAQPAGS
jgi:hypothetical protein